jgi:hypothetical protein
MRNNMHNENENENEKRKVRNLNLYLYMRTIGIPSVIFVASSFFLFTGRLTDGSIILLLSIMFWLLGKEFKMFKAIKAYRLRSLLFYSTLTVLTLGAIYGGVYFLPVIQFLLILYWAYYSTVLYIDDYDEK